MPKTFYTERDIEDLKTRGVTSLVLSDDVVITDQARERAMKLGFELMREHDQPMAAPVRPYIASQPSPAASPPRPAAPSGAATELEKRVVQAVQARLGSSVDAKLLETIVKRVLNTVGRG
ncbi:MAG: hypothetical protein HYZ26_10685 [Chloroflexi bacterium]|nr:hypothetical protein [Chloroflexota bacterium]